MLEQSLGSNYDLQSELILERDEEIKQIANDVNDLHEIMNDLNALTETQSAPLLQIHDNVEAAAKKTEDALKEIKNAATQQKKYRSRLGTIIATIVAAVGTLGAITAVVILL